jgi:hypothetical protein
MTVYVVIPCQKCRIYTVYIWFWPTLILRLYKAGTCNRVTCFCGNHHDNRKCFCPFCTCWYGMILVSINACPLQPCKRVLTHTHTHSHTSVHLLFSLCTHDMLSLLPALLQARAHSDFLMPLKESMRCSREQLALRIAQAVHAALPGFDVQVGAAQ